MSNRFAVILAAGQGTRMNSKLYKVLHPVCGKPMVEHVVDNISKLQVTETVTVVGFGADMVRQHLGGKSSFVIQEKQLGTAHAVMQAKDALGEKKGTTLVICGDTPLITSGTMSALIKQHEETGAKATVLTAFAENPNGYGRIIRNPDGAVERIVEHKDANEQELRIHEINAGTYCFDNEALFETLENVTNDNAQGEYYLPDVIAILKAKNELITAFQTDDFEETLGVNDRVALSEAERIMRKRVNEGHMRNGVTLIDPANTYIDQDVIIGQDTVIFPGTCIYGKTVIGEGCEIGPNTEIRNCEISHNAKIRQSAVYDSVIGANVNIGPFAHIRPESTIHDDVKIGNFVEIKKSIFGKGSKASHLSYIGDADIGKNVNIGCGSITVNYDGKQKHLTKIEDNVFVGCNSNLVAPVTVKKGSYIAAGSTITDDIPQDALAIARARQVNKEHYAKKLHLKK